MPLDIGALSLEVYNGLSIMIMPVSIYPVSKKLCNGFTESIQMCK